MPSITWKCASGRVFEAEVAIGQSLMEAARSLGVEGIHGDCGGNLACATCHVGPAGDWVARLGAPDAMEDDMLDMVDAGRSPGSRLSCQIRVTAELNGLLLHVPSA